LRRGPFAGFIEPVFPAKAGTQIHPERLVGFTWAPAFAGETEMVWGLAFVAMTGGL
jgi:hypothetical protein